MIHIPENGKILEMAKFFEKVFKVSKKGHFWLLVNCSLQTISII
jgi:hypothetical protein